MIVTTKIPEGLRFGVLGRYLSLARMDGPKFACSKHQEADSSASQSSTTSRRRITSSPPHLRSLRKSLDAAAVLPRSTASILPAFAVLGGSTKSLRKVSNGQGGEISVGYGEADHVYLRSV